MSGRQRNDVWVDRFDSIGYRGMFSDREEPEIERVGFWESNE